MRFESFPLADSRWTFNKVQDIFQLKIMKMASNIWMPDEFHERDESVCFWGVCPSLNQIYLEICWIIKPDYTEYFVEMNQKLRKVDNFRRAKHSFRMKDFCMKWKLCQNNYVCSTWRKREQFFLGVCQKTESKTLKKYFWLKCIFITLIYPFALMSMRRKMEIE